MNIFNVNFNQRVQDLLPFKLRKAILSATVRAMVSGVKSLYLKVQNSRSRNLYDLQHGQHVAHVEAVINDAFDMAFRRIRIVDAPIQYEPVWLFQDDELKPVYLYTDAEGQPIPLFTDYEIEFLGLDFVIQIPYTIPYDLARLMALVDKYKTPGMAYVIEEII